MTAQTTDSELPMPEPAVRERPAFRLPGRTMAGLGLLLVAVAAAVLSLSDRSGPMIGIGATILAIGLIVFGGLVAVAPGEARVLQFLGRYVGALHPTGL